MPPKQVHRYRIVREIGRGSMGRVFLAEDPNIDRLIALKVLSPRFVCEADQEDELRHRFLNEARAAGRLQHPRIVMVFDADIDPASGNPYLAMEWVDGPSLRQHLKARGKLTPAEAVSLIASAAAALDYAHEKGVVHRDIKPANLLLSADGVKVVDFGIAKLVSESLTVTGHLLGSPFYMAPEQIKGDVIDARTDLFALGLVFYECLTGRLAFEGRSLANVTYKILSVDPRPPEMYTPEITSELRTVLDRMLAKEPARRFQSGGEVCRALASLALQSVGDPTIAVTSDTSPRHVPKQRIRVRRLAWRYVLGVALVSIVVSSAWIASWWFDLDSHEVARDEGRASVELEKIVSEPLVATRPVETQPSSKPADFTIPTLTGTPFTLDLDSELFAELNSETSRDFDRVSLEELGESSKANLVSQTTDDVPPPPIVTRALPAGPVALTTLEIVYESHLKLCYLSVWVDGERRLTRRLESRNPMRRVLGQSYSSTMAMTAGGHSVEVHISGISRRFEASRIIRADFRRDQPRRLLVSVTGGTEILTLDWEAAL